ncbi:MAG: ferritin-like domain-containing protein [Acidimicrobiia bacterium]|nr:ferritin-like domain-containing protein [Acidimicrobiia bacterium]
MITILCNYCVGETAALDGASSLVRFAPERNAKIFMSTQVVDEARHLEVFLHLLADLGVEDAEGEIERRANPALHEFRGELLNLVDVGDWPAAVFAQNVVLETLEYTVFRFHADNSDPTTSEVLRGVIADERRHSGFGENHLGRWLTAHPNGRDHLRRVRAQLDPLVVGVFEGALADLDIPRSDRPPLANDYADAIDRLGLT